MPPYRQTRNNGPDSFRDLYNNLSKRRMKLRLPLKEMKLGESAQKIVYLRRPENDWGVDDQSIEHLLDPDLPKVDTKIKDVKPKKKAGHPVKTLGDIPSLTYNQKMTNWFTLNKLSDGKKSENKLSESEAKDKRSEAREPRHIRVRDKVKERNVRLKLFERQGHRSPPISRTNTVSREARRLENKLEARYKFFSDLSDERDVEEEIKYTRLLDGFETVRGDFENAKRNLGVTSEPPTKDELKQQRWDLVIRKHLQEKIDAGQKGYANLNEPRGRIDLFGLREETPKKNQTDVINGLRKSIRELSLKMSNTTPPDVPQRPNDYTVSELKCLLEVQGKESIPKFTAAQLRKVLNNLGFTRNVVNYDDLVETLDTLAMKKYGYGLGDKKLRNYLQKEADKLIFRQEIFELKKKASTETVHKKIQEADQNISAFLRNGKRTTGRHVPRRPLLKLFPPTYIIGNDTGLDHNLKSYYPPKTYRERKRIREADEFWKKYGKEDTYSMANWNKFRMDLEWKYHKNAMEGPGFPVQIKDKHPLIFGTDEAPIKLSPNFTTPDLIAAMNRIIHHPLPLDEEMDSYEKKIEGYREKFPRLFRFEQGNSPPQGKNGFTKKPV